MNDKEEIKQRLKEITDLTLEVSIKTKDEQLKKLLRLIRQKVGEALGLVILEERARP